MYKYRRTWWWIDCVLGLGKDAIVDLTNFLSNECINFDVFVVHTSFAIRGRLMNRRNHLGWTDACIHLGAEWMSIWTQYVALSIKIELITTWELWFVLQHKKSQNDISCLASSSLSVLRGRHVSRRLAIAISSPRTWSSDQCIYAATSFS